MNKPQRPYMNKYYPPEPPTFEDKVLFSKTLVDPEYEEQYVENYQDQNDTEEVPEFGYLGNDNIIFTLQDI